MAHKPSPGFIPLICSPFLWELQMLQLCTCPWCSLQPPMEMWGRNPQRVTPKESLLPLPAFVSHQGKFLRAPQERVLSLVWAGWWCHANTSGRTNTDFEGSSISVCLLLPFVPYKLYFLYVFFFKLIVFFFLKYSCNGHFSGYLCCSETNGTHNFEAFQLQTLLHSHSCLTIIF